MMKFKNIYSLLLRVVLWILALVIIEISTGIVRAYSIRLDLFISFLKWFVISMIILNKREKDFNLYMILIHLLYLTPILISIFQFVFHDKINIVAWPNLMLGLVGAWFGFLVYRSERNFRKILILLFGLFLSFLTLYNYDHINFVNTFGVIKYERGIWVNPELYVFSDKEKKVIVLEENKIYILDFWHSSCISCYLDFPEFNNRFNENKDPRLSYVAINYPLKNDHENTAFEIMEQRNYDFPVWKGTESIQSAFGIPAYSTFIALRNDTILYKGDLEHLDVFLKTLE